MPHPEGSEGRDQPPPLDAGAGAGAASGGEGAGAEVASAEGAAGRLKAKVLTVSDGVIQGTREDRSGQALLALLESSGFEVVETAAVADGVVSVAGALSRMAAGFAGVVVTTGGTGFAPRDQTPEGTKEIVERDAPGLSEAMRMANPRLGRLSRGVAGIKGQAIILNTPGSPQGATECLAAVIDALPHALDLLADKPTRHP